MADVIELFGVKFPIMSAEEEAREKAWQEEEDRKERHRHLTKRVQDCGARLTQGDQLAIVAGTLEKTQAIEHVDRWLASKLRYLVLSGGVGVGKTVAAAYAATFNRGAVVPAPHLAQRLDPWKHEVDRGVVRLSLRVPLLVIDDLGTEAADNARFAQAFTDAIDARQDHGRTLITTNLTGAQFKSRYDARIVDRIRHQGRFVELKGESLRGQQ